MPLKSFTQAEIALTQRRRMEIPLLAMIWLSIVTFTIAENGVFHIMTATLCVGLNFYAVLRDQEIFVHPTVVKLTALAAAIATSPIFFLNSSDNAVEGVSSIIF